jgi:hypothetical protein
LIIGQAVDLYKQLTDHPHYETHEIEVDGERRQAHRLHLLPHVTLLEDTLAVQSSCGQIHTRIDRETLDSDVGQRIAEAIILTTRRVAIPVQQQYH